MIHAFRGAVIMVIAQDFCPFEGDYGQIGFLICSDQQTIVLMCDECNRIWLSPDALDDNHALFADPPAFLVPGFDYSVQWPQSRWATRLEVMSYGWSAYIRGGSKALDEG
jgi:hypothetical protein